MVIFFLFIDKYFDMRKNQCKESLDIYIKFLERMTKLARFLKVAEVQKSISIQGFLLFSVLV